MNNEEGTWIEVGGHWRLFPAAFVVVAQQHNKTSMKESQIQGQPRNDKAERKYTLRATNLGTLDRMLTLLFIHLIDELASGRVEPWAS